MKIIGHRGAAGLAHENTLEAIQAGIKAGADEIEVDVLVTFDGVPIVYHDDHILADDGKSKLKVNQNSFERLKESRRDLVTLTEAIHATRGKATLMIDLKPHQNLEPVFAVLEGHLHNQSQSSDFQITSFDFATLKAFKSVLPQIELIVNERWSGVRASRRAKRLGTKRIQMNHRWLWHGFIKAIQRNCFQLSVYTVNTPTRIKKWTNLLYGVVTDRPDLFKK